MVSVAMLTVIGGVFSEEVFSEFLRSEFSPFTARDPGVRTGANGAGGMLPGLSPQEQQLFPDVRETFQEVQSVQGTVKDTEAGLGRASIWTVAPAVTYSRI